MYSQALDYTNKGTMNFKHEVKQVELLPTGSFGNGLTSGDIVRINLPVEDYHMNPYSSFVEITVDLSTSLGLLDDGTFTQKMLQLDSSAHSFISSLVISMRDKEIERIMNYDILGCFLKDVMYDQNSRTARDYEGNGGFSTPSTPNNVFRMDNLPVTNTGNTFPCVGFFPQYDANNFIDTNARTCNQSSTNPASVSGAFNYWTTKNIANNYTQLSFTPYFSKNVTTFNRGNVSDEYVQNYVSTSRATNNDSEGSGLYQAYNPTFANIGSEPYFSRTVPLRYLKSGALKVDFPTAMTFQVPLLSSFFGHLLPPENWKLIPMKFMTGTVLEFTFSPHALFSSWNTTDQTARNYQVKKFSLRTEMVKILDDNYKVKIEEEYRSKGIAIASHAFFCGPTYNVVNGAVPSSLYINLGFNSLKNLFFMFYSNDYLQSAASRKHYRLSMAITSMQLQTGVDFYPAQAITGNGGTNYGLVNNNEFVKYFWKCFNRVNGNSCGVINQHNFAINVREFNPGNGGQVFVGNNQLNYFLENRVIGKCVYGLPLDPMNYDGSMWSGLDTTQKTPFQLNLTYDNAVVFDRPVTMYTWMHHDVMLVVTPEEVLTVGRS